MTMKTRITLKCYILVLCSIYFSLLYVFYGRLQIEISQNLKDSYSNNVFKVLEKPKYHVHPQWKEQDIPDMKRRMLESKLDENGSQRVFSLSKINVQRPSLDIIKTTEKYMVEDTCYLSAQYPNRSFQRIQQFSYIYSAYLDERQSSPSVRIMAMFGNYKKSRLLPVYCYFNVEKSTKEWISVEGRLYELCENHGKKYGGFIVSCLVPENLTNVCSIGVYQQSTNIVRLPVTRLESKHAVHWRTLKHAYSLSNSSVMLEATVDSYDLPKLSYNYSICVPPLFGDISTIRFVEFIELHRILGFQHFIFYVQEISNPEILTVLKYYKRLNVVTVIQWKLPINGRNDIWYNGQLNAHNDCMYRAMSLSNFVAIIDIDEAIVPHDGHLKINESVEKLLSNENTCGLSFYSAFYSIDFSPKGEGDSDLISLSKLGRSQFSTVRTKVMVSPLKVFEVGIHHISKPFREEYKVLKVNQSTAFLHHYRKCVQNYGMKCGNFIEDNSMLKYKKDLIENVRYVFLHALSQHVLLNKNDTI